MKCDKLATMRVFWPGKPPIYQCLEHAVAIQGLGDVLGSYIHIEAYTGRERCSQEVMEPEKQEIKKKQKARKGLR